VVYTDGTPASGSAVAFTGAGPRAFASTGNTAADGTFALSTFEENDGAVPGNYQVQVYDPNGQQLTIVAGVGGTASVQVKKGPNVFQLRVQRP
jgi:hypothetical protein